MTEVTRILADIEQGDPRAAELLLPLVYDELRELAAARIAQEQPGQTLQATALVHEAYLRIVDVERAQHCNSRGHFFAAAAEAMRRILIDRAREKLAQKRGSDWKRLPLDEVDPPGATSPEALPAPGRRSDGSLCGENFRVVFPHCLLKDHARVDATNPRRNSHERIRPIAVGGQRRLRPRPSRVDRPAHRADPGGRGHRPGSVSAR